MKTNFWRILRFILWQAWFVLPFAHAAAASLDTIASTPVFPQPILWAGESAPAEVDGAKLLESIQRFSSEGIEAGIAALEAYIEKNPESSWNPSLESNLGEYYVRHGRYSLALKHWASAWKATKSYKQGDSKKIADATLVQYARLLASLGRKDTLTNLLQEISGRPLDGGPLQRSFEATVEGLSVMVHQPENAYRCGTFALYHVGITLDPTNHSLKQLKDIESPAYGFNMRELVEYAAKAGFPLEAAEKALSTELIVPSVIHWKENHYAAIIAKRGHLYHVVDPTFGKSKWLTSETIDAESSGKYLIPQNKFTDEWRQLTANEALQTRGKGSPNNIDDSGDEPCPAEDCQNCPPGTTPPGSGPNEPGSGPNPGGCGSCGGNGRPPIFGMPTWRVSEPFVTLWVKDIPYGYEDSFGKPINFELSYKQRNTRNTASAFSVGKLWECNWLSLVTTDWHNPQEANLDVAGGGQRAYISDGVSHDYKTGSTMTNYIKGGEEIYEINHRGGAKSVYGYQFGYLTGITNRYLSQKIEANGRTVGYFYQTTNSIVRLTHVVDADGRTNILAYTNLSLPKLITSVTSPNGQKAFLQYDSVGQLESVIDAIGMSNAFFYGVGDGQMTKFATPYGETTFQTTSNGYAGYNLGGEEEVNRSIIVTEPNGGKHMYFYRDLSRHLYPGSETPLVFSDQYSYWVYPPDEEPVTSPFYNTFENSGWNAARNSYYFGPRQFDLLSPSFKSSVAGAFDNSSFYNLTLTDYHHARIRHYLHQESDYYRVGQTLSLERQPSPDGTTPGLKTWYDYENKRAGDSLFEGDRIQPSIVAVVLPNGESKFTHIRHDDWGNATNIVETYSLADGTVALRTNVIVYSGDGIDRLHHVGPDGKTNVSYFYNADHQLLRMTNAVGEVTYYDYDGFKRLTRTRTPSGLTTTNIYFGTGDSLNRLQRTIDLEINRTNSYTYTNGLVLTHTNELGLVITNFWDALQRLRRVSYPDGTFITNIYDKLDLVRTIDRMGYSNSFVYDVVRRLTATTNALGRFTLFNYCSCGALDSMRDAVGSYTYYYYDNQGRLISTVFADGYAVTNQYSLLTQITNKVDSAGVSVTNWFNNQGLIYAVSNAVGRVSYRTFDLEDLVKTSEDANGVSVTNTYDALYRLLTRTYPDTGFEEFVYSTKGLMWHTNQLGKATRFDYDAARRKIAETNANGEFTLYFSDPAGNLTNLVDSKWHFTYWGYDHYGRVTSKTNHNGQRILAYQYDSNDRMTNRWTPAKFDTAYAYDPMGNLTNVNYLASPDISFQYDALNRLTNMVDGIGTTLYGYDTVGQLLSEDGPWTEDAVTYNYSQRLKFQASLQQPNASAWNQTYSYDAGRRLTNVISAAGTFDYYYDTVRKKQVQRLALPGGSNITNAFDSMGRMLSTTLKRSDGTLLNTHAYDYNVGSQRTKQTRTAGDYVDYTYDDVGQLKTAQGKELGGTVSRLHEQFTYAYDKAGNLYQRYAPPQLLTLSVNSLNQLDIYERTSTMNVAGATTVAATSVTVNSQPAIRYGDNTFVRTNVTLSEGNNTFTAVAQDSQGRQDTQSKTMYLPSGDFFDYDANGNMTSDDHRIFTYDDENQLISVRVENEWKSEFSYDGKMRRRIRREYAWISSAWVKTNEVRYVYDGNLVLQERTSDNIGAVYYTRGKDLSGSQAGAGGIGGLLARTGVGQALGFQTMLYHADANGNVTSLISTNELLVGRYTYDPFGNLLAANGAAAEANLYRFNSKEWHQNSGLAYYLYRYYEPNLQRWLNQDPIEERGGINLYEFVKNSPIGYIDALGLITNPACDAARQALQEALANHNPDDQASNEALEAANQAVDSACGKTKPLPQPNCPLPEERPIFERKKPKNEGSFCQRHPAVCIGIVIGAGAAVCIAQPELCGIVVRIGTQIITKIPPPILAAGAL